MDQSRRALMRTGLAALGGAVGLGTAAKLTAASGGSRSTGGSRPPAPKTLTLHGRDWHVTSPSRRVGEFPDAGEHMLVQGVVSSTPSGDKVGEFYGTYFGLLAPGRAAATDAASFQMHTFKLDDGTIVGSGTATPGHDTVDEFAIVGGTGAYANARGTYTARQSHQQFGGDGTATFTMTLVP